MKYYRVFVRNDRYRVAAPGWLFWNWVHAVGYDDWGVFETANYNKAVEKANEENKLVVRACNYSKSKWEAV